MRLLHVKGWGWLEGDTKWTPESPAKSVLIEGPIQIVMLQGKENQIQCLLVNTVVIFLKESMMLQDIHGINMALIAEQIIITLKR